MLARLQSKVALVVQPEGVSFQRPDRSVRLRWPEPHNAAQVAACSEQLRQLGAGPVPVQALADWLPLAHLCDLGLLNVGSCAALLCLKDFHYAASFPLIDAAPLGGERLQLLEQAAHAERFSPDATGELKLRVPVGLLRGGSAPRELFTRRKALPDETLVRLFATLFDATQKLYPSAGALYPVQLVVQQTDEGRSELTRFSATEGCLEREVVEGDPVSGAGYDEALVNAGTRLWLVADLHRSVEKYGERAYRYALIECGHIAQVLAGLLEANGFRVRPFGGFDDRQVGCLLRVSDSQLVCHALAVAPGGGPRPDAWVLGQETRYSVLGGHTLQYSFAYGGKTIDGDSIYGYGIALDKAMAELKAVGELAERLAMHALGPEVVNSNGMAAHVSLALAERHAALELYERHCILRVWLCRLRAEALALPATPEAEVLLQLAARGEARVRLLDVSDPAFGVPAVLAIAHHPQHGGLLAAGASADSEALAAQKAMLELAKLIYFRLVIRKTALFDADRPAAVECMEDHERYYASQRVARDETAFLLDGPEVRAPSPARRDLPALLAACRFDDLSAHGPEATRWKIARARSPQLLPLHFGRPPEGYFEAAGRLLGQSGLNLAPHLVN